LPAGYVAADLHIAEQKAQKLLVCLEKAGYIAYIRDFVLIKNFMQYQDRITTIKTVKEIVRRFKATIPPTDLLLQWEDEVKKVPGLWSRLLLNGYRPKSDPELPARIYSYNIDVQKALEIALSEGYLPDGFDVKDVFELKKAAMMFARISKEPIKVSELVNHICELCVIYDTPSGSFFPPAKISKLINEFLIDPAIAAKNKNIAKFNEHETKLALAYRCGILKGRGVKDNA